MKIKNVILLVSLATLFSCGNTATIKVDKSVPLKKGVSRYFVAEPEVKLELGHGAIPNDTTFIDQNGLKNEFYKYLVNAFKEKGQYAEDKASSDGVVQIKMDYLRKFNWGGKSLNKPEFSYVVTIQKDEKTLVQYSTPTATTFYGGLADTAVNLEISAFKWGVEDEPRDVELIANTIAREISNIGSK